MLLAWHSVLLREFLFSLEKLFVCLERLWVILKLNFVWLYNIQCISKLLFEMQRHNFPSFSIKFPCKKQWKSKFERIWVRRHIFHRKQYIFWMNYDKFCTRLTNLFEIICWTVQGRIFFSIFGFLAWKKCLF